MSTLTVFTPTFNRAHTLPRAYASLQRQTSRDFAWLVIDDGSTDGTGALIALWKTSADFRIEYVYQENRGKHAAHNRAVACTGSVLLMIMDSDDELLPDAVRRITEEWKGMSGEERARIAGIWTLCADSEGTIVGGAFPRDVFDSTLQALQYRDGVDKEMLPTFVTEVLRQYPFPETASGVCPYIPESYVWMNITRKRPLRFLNVPCRIYHKAEGGLLSMARDEYRLSHCIVYGYLSPLANDLEWFWTQPQWFLFNAVQAARYALFSRQFWLLSRTLSAGGKALLIAAVPLALLLIVKDTVNGRIAHQLGGTGPQQKDSK